MRILRDSHSDSQRPGPLALSLPPRILERAADGVCWMSLICVITSLALTIVQHVFQPEYAAAWRHPILQAATVTVLLLSIGFIAVQRSGHLSKQALLDLGMVFQVVMAFLTAIFESAVYKDPNAV